MPSRPPPADTKAVVSAYSWLQREAIAVAEGRTEIPVAVPRLVQLVPPARVDLVDEVLVRVALRYLTRTLDWPPLHVVQQLAFRVKRVHLGEVRMRGSNGEVVDVIRYTDKLGDDRRVYRLLRHGEFVGEYTTPEELGKVVELAQLVEEEDHTGAEGDT
jgi:hypothetical protein